MNNVLFNLFRVISNHYFNKIQKNHSYRNDRRFCTALEYQWGFYFFGFRYIFYRWFCPEKHNIFISTKKYPK